MDRSLSRREALTRVAAVGAAALSARFVGAQPASDPAFDRLARRHGFSADGPGLAVLVARPPKRGAVYCFGSADLEKKEPIGPRTIFELASVTKTFTSTAVLMLSERKVLSLEDDVRKFVPELPVYNEARPIRVEDLLRHTSGLPDYMGFEGVQTKHEGYAVNDDFLGEFAWRKEASPLTFPTGRKHEYNNTNYMLLATVIERASKLRYREFLRDNIFGPAGMDETFVYDAPGSVPEGANDEAAVGYQRDGTSWQPAWGLPPGRKEWLLAVGDGGIWSNLRDMAAWDAALHGGKLVAQETAKIALTPTKTPDGETHGYGLGWAVYLGDGGVMNGYGHDGTWGGFRHTYHHEPGPNLTTVVLSNRGDFDVDKFWYEMRDMIREGRLDDGPAGRRDQGGPGRRRRR